MSRWIDADALQDRIDYCIKKGLGSIAYTFKHMVDEAPTIEPKQADDLISRADAIEALGEEPPVWYDGEDEIAERNQWRRDVDAIKAMPSAQPKRGEWIVHKEKTVVDDSGFIDFFPSEYECSRCGLTEKFYFINSKPHNFCPNCGARMKGADDE